tara:strand:+ start:430 stop:1743 length:1314 start_codon:yes stop_codon:yes gene_type:complete
MIGGVNFLKKNEVLISSLIILVSIFFFDNKLIGFNKAKFFILLLVPFFFINLSEIYNRKLKIFFLIFFLSVSALVIHSGIKINFQYSKYNYYSIIYLVLLTIICLNMTKTFDEIINLTIKLFIISLNILFIILLLYELNDYNLYDHEKNYNGLCTVMETTKTIWKYLFIENSHFAMIATGIIGYGIYNFKKLNLFEKLNFTFFIIMSYIFISSLTLFLGVIISLVFCLILLNFNKDFFIKSTVMIMINIFFIFNLNNCFLRISQITLIENMYLDNKQNHLIQMFGVNEKKNEPTTEIKINSSTATHLNHMNFSIDIIKNNIFGIGFQNYGFFSYKYGKNTKLIDVQNDMALMNIRDGASTFNKLLAEFGIINILFVFFFIYSIKKSKLKKGSKIFILSLIITQLIRGAGYFNGGFIFFSLILFFSNYYFYKKNKLLI